ncbi:MAG: formate--tetrahydrofolate ligase [Firmicutes bacterium]|nr:formate--tetrahydrofolate ligase [Bacillota bacterium]
MLSDIEIAHQTRLKPIQEIAKSLGIHADELEPYGKYKAKVSLSVFDRVKDRPRGKLIFTTAITATPAGEGKTCTSIGLTQALGKLGKKVSVCLREPSLGPVFGIKGGAAGGGYAQVLPMEDINLHFTGDFAAVAAAHNLLAAIVDNHIYRGNELNIDVTKPGWGRVLDVNDRQLRQVVVGLGGKGNGIPKETYFEITAASEIMAILCLAQDFTDLKERLASLIVGYTREGRPVLAKELKATEAMAILLKDAIKPNLVQTLEGQPAFIHGGPFANIAHGNNSIIATKMALHLSDYVVTEGGFAADLGAEKFFDIVCNTSDLKPDVAVLVASVRALKMHGGLEKRRLDEENLEALRAGLSNLEAHLENLGKFGVPAVVAINRFPQDTQAELEEVLAFCRRKGVEAAVSEVVAKGGAGGVELAEKVLKVLSQKPAQFQPIYSLDEPIKDKIWRLATEIYGADGVQYSVEAEKKLKELTAGGYDRMPICMAKTQFSLSDDPSLLGAPKGWELTVRDVKVAAGAGFIICYTGEIRTMPGLPKHPAAEGMYISDTGQISGLF